MDEENDVLIFNSLRDLLEMGSDDRIKRACKYCLNNEKVKASEEICIYIEALLNCALSITAIS